MKNINILKDLKTLNKLHTSNVESHTTNNGIVDFTCENAGYVDNVVIEGKTLVNLIRTNLSVEVWDNNRVAINLQDCNYLEGTYTLFNFSDKTIVLDIGEATTNKWLRTFALDTNKVKTFNINNGERIFNVNGLLRDGWENNDKSKNEFRNSIVLLEGDHTDKPISYFEGLKSVGQGDKIEVVTREHNKINLLKNQNVTYKDNYMIDYEGGLESASNNHKYTETYIEIEPNTDYCFYHTSRNICWYDENKNFIFQPLNKRILGENMNKDLFFSAKSPSNAKYLRITIIKAIHNNGEASEIYKGKYDHKQISTTLRSLPNGVKDTIEKRGNKYVKVQRCGEYTFTGYENISFISDTNGLVQANIDVNFAIKSYNNDLLKNIVSNMLPSLGNTTNKETIFRHPTVNNCIVVRISNSKITADKTVCLNYIKDKLTIVYELATPIVIELPNFNSQTYKGDNTLLINSGVIQCDASFDVREGIRSELDVIKDKVSSLDDYESGYEFSNEIIYLNGTYKPGFAETPYIVRLGKICILHCAIGNNAPQRGMHVLKLPSFAKPKDHHRCAGRAKINDETINPILVDYDITLDNTVQLWTTHETAKLNELYIHMIWEVE